VGQSTLFKKAILRRCQRKAVTEGLTLLAALEALLIARVDENVSGRTIRATAGNGHSVEFEVPEGLTPVSMVELASELIDLYETARGYLGGSPTDAQVYAEMLGLLKPCDEVHSDFTLIRTEVAA